MKVIAFQQAPYRHLPARFEDNYDSVVTPPYGELVEPERMQAAYMWCLDELAYAAELGFDGVGVTEHSQSTYDVMPNPNLAAAALAYVTESRGQDAAITVMGRSLGKSREPLRIAEEYAMLDCISGGRLIAGMPIGLSYDANVNGGIPAIETRSRYWEGRSLVQKAWIQDQAPFPWNGKYSKYPFVNIWPRPIQQPPPVWVPAVGNPRTMAGILESGDVYNYLSWFGPKLTAKRVFDRFWDMAAEMGKELNPNRVAFLQVVCVAETDERAEREYAKHLEYHFRTGLGSIPAELFGLPGYLDIRGVEGLLRDPGDLGIYEKLRHVTFKDLVDTQVAIVGSPATVADRLSEFLSTFRIGNLIAMTHVGSMPHDLTRKNLELFATEVLPKLRLLWPEDEWEHHWWPKGLADGARRAEKRESVGSAARGEVA